MKVRWLGNSCVEIVAEKRVLIDPNYILKPEKVDVVCVTHEHSDHIDVEKLKGVEFKTLLAPEATVREHKLEEFNPVIVKAGDEFDGIKVLESWCWKAKESVSYLCYGVLHTGDSAKFPEAKGVKLAFTACFPDFYEEYLKELSKIKPELVVPIHYDYERKRENAEKLVELLKENGLNARILKPGEVLELR